MDFTKLLIYVLHVNRSIEINDDISTNANQSLKSSSESFTEPEYIE